MKESCASNVRVRVNVVLKDETIKAPEKFQKSLTGEELHQWIELFWINRRQDVLKGITPEQKAELEYLKEKKLLRHPYKAVCTAQSTLLQLNSVFEQEKDEESPPAADGPQAGGEVEEVKEVEAPAAEPPLNPQDIVVEAPVLAKQLVLAPPGTGKTHTVIDRLIFLSQNHFQGDLVPVLVVTFSRTARAEVQQRLVARLKGSSTQLVAQAPQIRTLDSFTSSILIGSGVGQGPGEFDDRIRRLAEVLEGLHGEDARVRAGEMIQSQIKVVVLDEVQDIVGVRARLVVEILSLFRSSNLGLSILGDLRQAINDYKLDLSKGCKPEEIGMDAFWLVEEARKIFGDLEQVEFERQYRFSPSCTELMRRLKAAMDAPGELPGKKPDRERLSEIFAETPQLPRPYDLTGEDFADRKIAILARGNPAVKKLEAACTDVLKKAGRKIKVKYLDKKSTLNRFPAWIGRVFGRKEAPDFFDRETFEREYQEVVGRDLPEARARLDWLFDSFTRLSRQRFSRGDIAGEISTSSGVPANYLEQPKKGEVWISTIHQAKGKEFDVVVVANPLNFLKRGDASECRIAYVAATRAKKKLYRCGGRDWLGKAFLFKDYYYDIEAMIDIDSVGPDEWQEAQNELWQAKLGDWPLELFSPDRDGSFVLTVRGSKRRVVRFTESFSKPFTEHARNELGVDNAHEVHFTVRMSDLHTISVPPDNRLMFVPDLLGKISRKV